MLQGEGPPLPASGPQCWVENDRSYNEPGTCLVTERPAHSVRSRGNSVAFSLGPLSSLTRDLTKDTLASSRQSWSGALCMPHPGPQGEAAQGGEAGPWSWPAARRGGSNAGALLEKSPAGVRRDPVIVPV